MSARAWQYRRAKANLMVVVDQLCAALAIAHGLPHRPRPNRAELARRRRLANLAARRQGRR